ncbi:MAG: aldehyde ferredoxin oxidoreductase N-terminal domain-containing protein [Candidatus Bathyarchaeia archaeon]
MEIYGWVGKILRVNLTTGRIEKIDTMKYAEKFIGGRGIAAAIAWEEMPFGTDPLSPENKLIMMTGPLTGTIAPTSGRMVFAGIAPQAYPKPHYTRSNMGGYFGAELKYAGYDGIIIEGKAEKPVYLWINDGEVEIRDAVDLWGLDTFETQKKLMKEHGEDSQTICIGPAGENLVRIATIHHGLESAAGQGGFGAVMGSKNLKAVTVKGSGMVKVARPKELMEICKYFRKIRNERILKRREQNLKVCSLACNALPCGMIVYRDVEGKHHSKRYTGAVHCCSPIYLRFKPWEAGFEAAEIADRLGLNHWEIVLGFTGVGKWLDNCVKVGLITEEDLGMPIDLESGVFWSKLLEKIAYREGVGKVLAEGVPRAIDMLGKGQEFSPHVAHGFETHWDGRLFGAPKYPYWIVAALQWAMDSRDPLVHCYAQNITYWVMRPDAPISVDKLKAIGKRLYGSEVAVDPESGYEYKAQPTIWHQNRLAVDDSLLVCDQSFPIIFSPSSPDGFGDTGLEAKMLSAVTGIDITEEELDFIGSRIYNLERAIMVLEGRTRKDDEAVIPYFQKPDVNGIRLDVNRFKELMDEFYRLRGWDPKTGWPKRETLEKHDLKEVADKLESVGRLPE